jgi:co-chaperonin GroES (HSP10)
MKPLHDNLIIEPISAETKTESGIILGFTDGQSQLLREVYSNRAMVKALGNGVKGFEVGDEVVMLRWGAQEIDGENWVINQRDVIAKVEVMK